MNTKPERKNLFYSLLLAGFLMLFLTGYFACMMPSLYVDYLMDENLKSIREQHCTYVETGSYETVRVKNPTACFSFYIPNQGNQIFLTGKAFSLQITLSDPALLESFNQYRSLFYGMWSDNNSFDNNSFDEFSHYFEEWAALLQEAMPDSRSLPVEITFLQFQTLDNEYRNERFVCHPISDQLFILESGVEAANNSYTNYIAMEKLPDGFVLSLLPVVTPDINEIRPVIFQSLPMLAAAVLLLVLLFSQIYSKGIIAPANRLIAQNYAELEQKNQALAEENQRQEIFLRASSHQLKTPVSAALLLVDGMIGKVGKYCDTDHYLPKVKEQLLSMRKIVDEILSLNRLKNRLHMQKMDLEVLLDSRLRACQILITERQLTVIRKQQGGGSVLTDEQAAALILDNLLSNAVCYTPPGGSIEIRTFPGVIQIRNYGARIPDDLLPHILEPFVSGQHGAGGHGLGLYIASCYARMVNARITVTNEGESVLAVLSFSMEGGADG